jgi:hypothetical protein
LISGDCSLEKVYLYTPFRFHLTYYYFEGSNEGVNSR